MLSVHFLQENYQTNHKKHPHTVWKIIFFSFLCQKMSAISSASCLDTPQERSGHWPRLAGSIQRHSPPPECPAPPACLRPARGSEGHRQPLPAGLRWPEPVRGGHGPRTLSDDQSPFAGSSKHLKTQQCTNNHQTLTLRKK